MERESFVEIFDIRFPLYTKKEALDLLLSKIGQKRATGVSILDMSALNIVYRDPLFKRALQEEMVILNDGVGLELAAKWQGTPFPENLNGTDLVPELLRQIPPKTKVYLIGGEASVAKQSASYLEKEYPHLAIVGSHSGFFSFAEEKKLIQELIEKQPALILVGMGNPQQVFFIKQYKDQINALWIAVGGLFDFWGGSRKRAPAFLRACKMEWLHIVYDQPYKWGRYFIGVPLFLWRILGYKWQPKGPSSQQ